VTMSKKENLEEKMKIKEKGINEKQIINEKK
jgi:hypothetical protein